MNNLNDDSFVLDKCKFLSDILRSRYGASGRSLGEQTNSIANKLPISMVLALRRLTEIRNKIAKDRKIFPLTIYRDEIDRHYFETLASEIENYLQRIAAPEMEPVYFIIVNKMSGKTLDLAAWSTDEGGVIHQWELHRGNNQLWLLNKIDNEFYSIISRHSGKCIEIRGGSYDKGTTIQQWSYAGLEHQQWQFLEQPDGSFQIKAKHSQKCLDAHYPKIYEDGAAIVQWDWWDSDNQKWWLKPMLH